MQGKKDLEGEELEELKEQAAYVVDELALDGRFGIVHFRRSDVDGWKSSLPSF